MFVVASLSLRSLLVFRPLVRRGEGAERPPASEYPSDLDEEFREAKMKPTGAEDLGSYVRTSLLAPGVAMLGEAAFAIWSTTTVSGGSEGPGGLSSYTGASAAATASFSWTSTSCSASKLFLVSSEEGAAVEGGEACVSGSLL